MANSLTSAINSDSTLSSAGITATASGSVVSLAAASTAGPITILPNTNGTVTETVGGTINAGDVVSVTVYDAGIPQDPTSGLPAGQRSYVRA